MLSLHLALEESVFKNQKGIKMKEKALSEDQIRKIVKEELSEQMKKWNLWCFYQITFYRCKASC
jgi:hypothetical protein